MRSTIEFFPGLAKHQPCVDAAVRSWLSAPPFPMTIRLRLTLWYTALLGTTLILFSVIVYSALTTNLWSQVEQDAARQAREITRALTQQFEFDILIIRNNPTRMQFPDIDFFASASGVQVVSLDGTVYKRSSNLPPQPVPDYRIALAAIRNGYEHRYYVKSGAGSLFLVYSVPVVLNGETIWGAVQVIKQVQAVENALSQVSRYLIFGTALSLVLAAIVGAFLARRTLAPIDEITNTASGITRTKDLRKRLRIVDDSNEIGVLAATFNAMLDQIQRLFETQQQLIADVSHELRTPLTTVRGNVELLQKMLTRAIGRPAAALDREALSDILTEVQEETARMSKMVGDLLLLAQADSGALQLQREAVEMDTLLLEVYRQAQRLAEQQKGGGALEIRLGHEDQAVIWGDRERLRQALLNLVDNAIKYTPSGGVITLGLDNQDGWVKVYVADTGIGISPENQPLVFRRFYRTDKARSRELGGSGLGLSIAQSIAEAHSGRVTVESAPQHGSTFTLWLPGSDMAEPPADTGGPRAGALAD